MSRDSRRYTRMPKGATGRTTRDPAGYSRVSRRKIHRAAQADRGRGDIRIVGRVQHFMLNVFQSGDKSAGPAENLRASHCWTAKDPTEAEEHTLAGYRILTKQTSPSVTWVKSARQDLVTIYEALQQAEK